LTFPPILWQRLKLLKKSVPSPMSKSSASQLFPSEVDWDRLSDLAKNKHAELIEEFEESEEVLPSYIKSIAPGREAIR
jgi:hypothetical protein